MQTFTRITFVPVSVTCAVWRCRWLYAEYNLLVDYSMVYGVWSMDCLMVIEHW